MADKKYTKNGEWISFDGQSWRVGLATSSAAELGEVTFVAPPQVGQVVAAGEASATIEAVKAAADYYAPVSGRVVSINPRLTAEPQLVGTDPESEGWLFSLDEVKPEEVSQLLDASAWEAWEKGL